MVKMDRQVSGNSKISLPSCWQVEKEHHNHTYATALAISIRMSRFLQSRTVTSPMQHTESASAPVLVLFLQDSPSFAVDWQVRSATDSFGPSRQASIFAIETRLEWKGRPGSCQVFFSILIFKFKVVECAYTSTAPSCPHQDDIVSAMPKSRKAMYIQRYYSAALP